MDAIAPIVIALGIVSLVCLLSLVVLLVLARDQAPEPAPELTPQRVSVSRHADLERLDCGGSVAFISPAVARQIAAALVAKAEG